MCWAWGWVGMDLSVSGLLRVFLGLVVMGLEEGVGAS